MTAHVDRESVRQLTLRYPATCACCGMSLAKGTIAVWDRSARTATCLGCGTDEPDIVEHAAGASAAAEGKRRVNRTAEAVRRQYGDAAAKVAREIAGRDAAATWGKGSDGESRLAAFIEREVGDGVIALHDRLIPGTKTNIDHLFVAPMGVWIVDAKSYTGKVELRERGPIWKREHEVYVNGRNRTSQAKAMDLQVHAVKAALDGEKVDLYVALCFVDSEWGLLDFPFYVGKVWVGYPGALRKQLKKTGPLDRATMERVATHLAQGLPPAS